MYSPKPSAQYIAYYMQLLEMHFDRSKSLFQSDVLKKPY